MDGQKNEPKGVTAFTGALSFACILCSSIALWGFVFFIDWKSRAPCAGYAPALLLYIGLCGPILGVCGFINYLLDNKTLKGIEGVVVCMLIGIAIFVAIPFFLPNR